MVGHHRAAPRRPAHPAAAPARPGRAIAVVAPGTGLGEAFLTWAQDRCLPRPSEGGHGDFAPGDQREAALLEHLRDRYGHVSWELVCSGMGIPNLYDFLTDNRFAVEAELVVERLATAPDRTRAIVEAGMNPASGSALFAETLRMFTAIIGAEAGNLALTVLATGGCVRVKRGLPTMEGESGTGHAAAVREGPSDGGMEHPGERDSGPSRSKLSGVGRQLMKLPGEDLEPGSNHLVQDPWPRLHCRPPGGGEDGIGCLSGFASVYRLAGRERA